MPLTSQGRAISETKSTTHLYDEKSDLYRAVSTIGHIRRLNPAIMLTINTCYTKAPRDIHPSIDIALTRLAATGR
jgi:hypothetical protein